MRALLLCIALLARDCTIPWPGGASAPPEPVTPDCNVSTCAIGDLGGCTCVPGTHYACEFNASEGHSSSICVADTPASACREADVFCRIGTDCCSGTCDVPEGSSTGFCADSQMTCGPGLMGDPCSGAADCVSCLCEPSALGSLCL